MCLERAARVVIRNNKREIAALFDAVSYLILDNWKSLFYLKIPLAFESATTHQNRVRQFCTVASNPIWLISEIVAMLFQVL